MALFDDVNKTLGKAMHGMADAAQGIGESTQKLGDMTLEITKQGLSSAAQGISETAQFLGNTAQDIGENISDTARSFQEHTRKPKIEKCPHCGEVLNGMAGYDLLVIDDFGLMELDMDKCRDLFEIIESRDCRKSSMIVSQLPVIKWWDLFVDNTYADAFLSRMTAKAYRLECNGRDMRKPV